MICDPDAITAAARMVVRREPVLNREQRRAESRRSGHGAGGRKVKRKRRR